jgi:DNA-binding transcriptional regulator WhiA
MAWGTEFTADLYLSRLQFNSVEEIDQAIQDENDNIARVFNRLTMLAAGSAKDLVSPEYEGDVMGFINFEINDAEQTFRESYQRIMMLETLKDNFETAKKV